MAANPKLTKDWIQYLKNNQIVDTKSDPNTGKLSYRRAVTANDLHEFLELKTDYSPEEISNAIHMVLSKKAIGQQNPKIQNNPSAGNQNNTSSSRDLSTWHHTEMRPGAFPPRKMPSNTKSLSYDQPPPRPEGPRQLGHDKNLGATDIEYRDIPDEEQPKKKWWQRKGVKEDITDDQGYELDEKDVESVFTILSGSSQNGQAASQGTGGSANSVQQGQAAAPQKAPRDAVRDLNKIKRLIRDKMSDGQRKAFWRALNDA